MKVVKECYHNQYTSPDASSPSQVTYICTLTVVLMMMIIMTTITTVMMMTGRLIGCGKK